MKCRFTITVNGKGASEAAVFRVYSASPLL